MILTDEHDETARARGYMPPDTVLRLCEIAREIKPLLMKAATGELSDEGFSKLVGACAFIHGTLEGTVRTAELHAETK